MKEAAFLVQGSAQEPYEVHFRVDGRNFTGICSCPAGVNGQYCKHRFGIMSGLTKGVVSENFGDVAKVASWVKETDVGEIWDEVRDLEQQVDALNQRLSTLKKKLALKMRD